MQTELEVTIEYEYDRGRGGIESRAETKNTMEVSWSKAKPCTGNGY